MCPVIWVFIVYAIGALLSWIICAMANAVYKKKNVYGRYLNDEDLAFVVFLWPIALFAFCVFRAIELFKYLNEKLINKFVELLNWLSK